LSPDQAYDNMYAQGPPSVHSSHTGRPYQQQGKMSNNLEMSRNLLTMCSHTHLK